MPIYKKGDPCSVDNYRGVNLLVAFSKIIEKMSDIQVRDYFEEKWAKNQFGFLQGKSTLDALFNFVSSVSKNLNKQLAASVQIDARKAFDSLPHCLLLKKLADYGIRGKELSWFQSYLSGRTQLTEVGDCRSSLLEVKTGVPQGSILGPTLFIIYVNDLPEALDCSTVMFADDTSLVVRAPTLPKLKEKVQQSLNSLSDWFKRNGLTLHPSKTVLNIHGKIDPSFEVNLNGHSLRESEEPSTPLLGVQISKNLCWKSHIEYVIEKLKSAVNCLSRSRPYLDLNGRLSFFHSFIVSTLKYCLPIWGYEGIKNSDIHKLYKKSIRLVKNKRGAIHTSPMCKELGILPLSDLYEHSLWCCAQKYLNDVDYEHLFCTRSRSADQNKMKTPLVCGKRQSMHEMARAWNSLPENLKEYVHNSPKQFSKVAKGHLISKIPNTVCTNSQCFECKK